MPEKPTLALINPRSPLAMWYPVGFTKIFAKAFCPNLALPTLAALVPERFELEVWDETLSPVPADATPDIVAITGYSSQAARMLELSDHFRERGSLVCLGGIHASCVTDEVREQADVIFVGEAERTWPLFLEDYLRGAHQETYVEEGQVDLSEAPLPDVRQMSAESYILGLVQTSRGCPHDCEFCSVVEFLGHRVRVKPPERTVAECDALYRAGFRSIFITDDNLFARKSHARRTLAALASWNEHNDVPADFITQATVDIADDSHLLSQLSRTGVTTLFVGIESSDPESLKEMGKRPNLERDLAKDLRTLARSGLWVHPGLIIGFDHDTTAVFERTYEFVQSSAALMPMIVPLMAAPRTKLEERLKAAGRWRGRVTELGLADELSTNVVPAGMTYDELLDGYLSLMKRVYAPESFLERLVQLESLWTAGDGETTFVSKAPLDFYDLTTATFAAFEKFGPAFRRVVKESFRVGMRHPAHAQNIFLSLMFLQHVLCLVQRWDRP